MEAREDGGFPGAKRPAATASAKVASVGNLVTAGVLPMTARGTTMTAGGGSGSISLAGPTSAGVDPAQLSMTMVDAGGDCDEVDHAPEVGSKVRKRDPAAMKSSKAAETLGSKSSSTTSTAKAGEKVQFALPPGIDSVAFAAKFRELFSSFGAPPTGVAGPSVSAAAPSSSTVHNSTSTSTETTESSTEAVTIENKKLLDLQRLLVDNKELLQEAGFSLSSPSSVVPVASAAKPPPLLDVAAAPLLSQISVTAQKQENSVFGQISKSVVKIYNTSASYDYDNPWSAPKQGQGHGSGFIISKNRIVTNAHVVSNTTFIQVRKAGTSKKFPAKLRRILHSVDLALLELDAEAIATGNTKKPSKSKAVTAAAAAQRAPSQVEPSGTPGTGLTGNIIDPVLEKKKEKAIEDFFRGTIALEFGETPRVGDEVFAYGFPWGGEEMSLTKGVVSRVEMNEAAHGSGSEVLSCDMDTAIVGGNSGGPVIGGHGSTLVVGVVFQGYDSKPGGYMIAVEVLKRVVELDDEGRSLITPSTGITAQKLENRSLRRALGLDERTTEDAMSPKRGAKEGTEDENAASAMDDVRSVESPNEKGGSTHQQGNEGKAMTSPLTAVVEGTKNVVEENQNLAEDDTNCDGQPAATTEIVKAKDGTPIAVTRVAAKGEGAIEGGIMICRVGDYSPLSNILLPNDVLLQIEKYEIGENGTIELRPGERTRWTHACYTGKTIGESIFFKWFRNGNFYSGTVPLTVTPGDVKYAIEYLYDVRPQFVLRGGAVFQPLTRNLCMKGAGVRPRIKALMYDYRTRDNHDFVVLTKVLQADLTAGYDRVRYMIVERINGEEIRTLQDVVKAFDGREPHQAQAASLELEEEADEAGSLTPRSAFRQALRHKKDATTSSTSSSSTNTSTTSTTTTAGAGEGAGASAGAEKSTGADETPLRGNSSERTYTIELENGQAVVLISSSLAEDTKKIAATYHVPLLEHLAS